MFLRSGLSREQEKAISVLEENLPGLHTLEVVPVCAVPAIDELTCHDSKCFVTKPVATSALPRGISWLWNQSRSRKTLTSGNTNVSFYKLSTKRAPHSTATPPPFKMWVYNLTFLRDNKQIGFLWCEKGTETDQNITNLNIEDYNFLAPFMSQHCAAEFGWLDILENQVPNNSQLLEIQNELDNPFTAALFN